MPTQGEIVAALRSMSLGEFKTTIARARPPEDYDSGARKAAAAEGLRALLRRGSTSVADALGEHNDSSERRAAARRLLHGHAEPDAAERRKTEAVVRLSDYQRSSLGRGTRITPGTAPSDRSNALDAISQHVNVDPSPNTGGTY
ncbi:hypothetical protein AWC02_14935 [Mycolicibacter engbaekii]|uniref:Uncharacterized protein n=1 Tax=Mycolicibacter engbaekii TaxID=188915 RepID=A0A1X1TJ94_9MYCO|nr:hypothetical protein [Mycolicibacter engbaekii]ORV44539.1 hypothetical protein AWC02_14935 [Mycolicibacter engbaekii]